MWHYSYHIHRFCHSIHQKTGLNINKLNYIIYDLEATCWEGGPEEKEMEIIEIGAFRLNDFGEVRGKFSRFVRPILNPTLSDFCMGLTSIKQVEVNRADTYPSVIEEFKTWAHVDQEEYALCSWGSFDRKMLIKDCQLHDLEHRWAKQHINLKEQYMKINRLHRSMGLKAALKREGLEFVGTPHRGISDAENTVGIFLKYFGVWKL